MIDFDQELNSEQRRVVTEGDGPCLVLAGAGSGKTRTLVYRVAYLLQNGVKPESIMLLTFTNKAAKEMISRIQALCPENSQGIWGGTFHHVGNRILRQYGRHLGIAPNFSILDVEDSAKLVKACLLDLGLKPGKDFPKASVIAKITSLATNTGAAVEDVIADKYSYFNSNTARDLQKVIQRYYEKKSEINALDFDDLLNKWLHLLVQAPEVRQTLQERFAYLLIDEHQDTNYIQSEIIRLMAGPAKNVLVVGDDSQSIYSFRGADVNNILSFPQIYPEAKVFRLETNYRSTPEILRLANESIKFNSQKFDKTLNTHKGSGSTPQLVRAADNYQQAEIIIQQIVSFIKTGRYKLNDFAILFRSHFQSLELEILLNKYNLPYRLRGGVRFFEQAHLKDVMAYLKVLNNFHDQVSWLRILGLQEGIGDATAHKIFKIIDQQADLTEALSADFREVLSLKVFNAWRETSGILRQLKNIGEQNVAALAQAVLQSGYQNYLKANYDNFSDRLADLQQLIVFAADYQSLTVFLADVTLSESFENDGAKGVDESRPAITLTTIHQAKGLEWPVVFIIGLAEGQFPHAKVSANPVELEEERRLFYVAVTRAKDLLYLLYPRVSNKNGYMNLLSKFITELPLEVYGVDGEGSDEIVYEAEY